MLENIYRKIKEYNTIVIARHIGVDPDALGSQLSLKLSIQNTFKDKKVYGLVGGFHLFNKTEQEVRDLAHKIKETNIEYICTGHCTKEAAYNILKEELGDKLHQLHVGLEMKF